MVDIEFKFEENFSFSLSLCSMLMGNSCVSVGKILSKEDFWGSRVFFANYFPSKCSGDLEFLTLTVTVLKLVEFFML